MSVLQQFPSFDPERRSMVLAKLQLELESAHDEIDRLQMALNREVDRGIMLDDERNRWCNDALRHRALVDQLAATLEIIRRATLPAQDIVRADRDLDPAPPSELGAEYPEGNAA